MRNYQWTIAVTAILASGMLAGCALPGRFNREQYAALDSDPFLSTGSATLADTNGSDVDHAGTMHSEVAHAEMAANDSASMEEEEQLMTASADEPGEVTFESEAESNALVDWGSQAEVAVVATTNNSEEPQQALADFFGDSPVADVSEQVTAAVTEVDRGFNDFLTDQSSKVVQASSEVAEVVKTAGNSVRHSVHQSDTWGYPGESSQAATPPQQKMAFQPSNPFDREPAELGPNPFGEKDPLPTVAPPSDLFGKPSQDSAWPPGNFKPN